MYPTLDKPLQRFFILYTKYLVKYWYLFVLFPLLLTTVLSTGLLRIQELTVTNARYLYTPDDSPCWTEERILKEHWPLQHDRFLPGTSYDFKRFLMVICTPKYDDSNLLDGNLLQEIMQLDESIAGNVTIFTENSKKLAYDDLCLGWGECYRTGGPGGLLHLLQKKDFFDSKGISISYPRANTGGNPIYLAYNLGGVSTDPKNGSILTVGAIKLVFFLRSDIEEYDHLSIAFENAAQTYLQGYQSDKIDIYYFHSQSVDNGLHDNATKLAPRLVLTFLILISVSVVCMLRIKWTSSCPAIDLVRSKPLLAIVGICTVFLALISGVGSLLLCGADWVEMSAIVPFLIVAIGVDDMFILVAAWENAPSTANLQERMQSALSEAAVAISITSLTDALSFSIGCVTSLPAVRGFCLTAAACIVFNFFYQITFFAGLMVVAGHWEVSNRNCLRGSQVASKTANEKTVWKEDKSVSKLFIETVYGPLLLHPLSKTLVSLAFLVYITGAIIGCLNIQEGLEYDKLLLSTDPTTKYLTQDRKYFHGGAQVEVVLNHAPSLISIQNRIEVERLVQEFENNPFATGVNGTQFWLREFVKYQSWAGVPTNVIPCRNSRDADYSYDYEDEFTLPSEAVMKKSECLTAEEQQKLIDIRDLWINGVYNWLQRYSFYKLWSQDIVWFNSSDPETRAMPTFRFRISLRASHDSNDVKMGTRELRRIAGKYARFNVTTYQLYREVADQMGQILGNTLQNVSIALGCMVLVALILIPNPFCTVWITLAIVSIDIGVVGYMSWWNVNLDPVSMINIIMSIGFSVDFSAHITYGYMSSPSSLTPKQRTISALVRLAWPVFQGALSTVLGVSLLAFVDSYIVTVFFKTIFLVILFGIIHALVFLPVLLSSCMPLVDKLCSGHNK